MTQKTRATWGSTIGFILAATGSAIGLGNIWKFPYITGVYGGGAFVLIYLFCIALIGLPLMYAEITIGKAGRSDPVGSMWSLAQTPPTRALALITGGLGVLSGFLILSFYSVIAGWAIHFLKVSIQGYPGGPEGVAVILGDLASAGGEGGFNFSLLWHSVFMGLTIFIVAFGVRKGIELACTLLMPILAVLLVVLMVMGLSMEGGSTALSFMFKPDFSALSADAVLEALGHSFFTLSLGMGAMITYGSYVKRDSSVVKDALAISIMDTAIAMMAGIAIFSVTFTYCLEPGTGPGLLFATLPVQFAQMSGGQTMGILFFALVVFAALTSAISLLEVVTAFFVDRFKVPRKIAAVAFGGVIYGLGVACVYSTGGVLDFLDNLTTKYTLPIGGLLIALFAGFIMQRAQAASGMSSERSLLFRLWLFVIRFVTPLLVIVVLLNKTGLLTTLLNSVGLESLTVEDAVLTYPQTDACSGE